MTPAAGHRGKAPELARRRRRTGQMDKDDGHERPPRRRRRRARRRGARPAHRPQRAEEDLVAVVRAGVAAPHLHLDIELMGRRASPIGVVDARNDKEDTRSFDPAPSETGAIKSSKAIRRCATRLQPHNTREQPARARQAAAKGRRARHPGSAHPPYCGATGQPNLVARGGGERVVIADADAGQQVRR